MNQLISIVIPIYNAEKSLENCIKSVCNQTYHNLEIILVNDGSIDASSSICNQYSFKDKRIKVIHQKNQGVSVARNAGIEASCGDWIMFVDSDDYIDIQMCEKLINKSQEEVFDLVLCGYIKRIVSENVVISQECFLPQIEDIVTQEELCKEWGYLYERSLLMSPCLKLYKNSIIKKNKVKFDKNLSLGEDRIFNLEYFSCFKFLKIGIINEPLYFYIYNCKYGLSKLFLDDEQRAENDRFLFSQEIRFARKLGNKACSHVSRSYLFFTVINASLIFKKMYRKSNSYQHRQTYIRNIIFCKETREAINFEALDIKHNICRMVFKIKSVFLLKFFALAWCIFKKWQ